MKRRVFLRLEGVSLVLWWLALSVILLDKMGGLCLIAVHPAKLLILPAMLTTLFGRLERKEREGLTL